MGRPSVGHAHGVRFPYRRDMGGSDFVMMKDISAPITVRGWDWVGLRLAVKV